MKKPKYSDRLIFGLGIPGCVLGGVGLLLDHLGLLARGGVASNVLFGVAGTLAGLAWVFTMLNAAYRHAKDDENYVP